MQANYYSSGDERTYLGRLPRHPPPLTAEERRIFADCTREALWLRSLPLGLFMGASTAAAIRRSILVTSPRFGAWPKAIVAFAAGCLLGKVSYVRVCQEKFLVLAPESSVSISIRRTRGVGTFDRAEERALEAIHHRNHSTAKADEMDDDYFQRPDIYSEKDDLAKKSFLTYGQLREQHRSSSIRKFQMTHGLNSGGMTKSKDVGDISHSTRGDDVHDEKCEEKGQERRKLPRQTQINRYGDEICMSSEGGGNRSATPNETRVIEECWQEAFWYRSVPLATMSGAAIFVAIRRGKLKPNVRFGPWPKVLSASFASYYIGKISYLLGKECQDKFLREAPESEIAYRIREQKGLSHPQNIDKHQFHSEDDEIDEEWTTITAEDKEIKIQLSNKELHILEECRKISMYYCSLPLSVILGGSLWTAQIQGIISESKRLKPPFKRVPKVVAGVTIGYVLGQILYVNSSDCADRFLREAPNGVMAANIRKLRKGDVHKSYREDNLGNKDFMLSVDPYHIDDYIIPSRSKDLEDIDSVTTGDLLNASRSSKNGP